MIPTEDNYVEWFTCAARFYFLREGYAFLSFALAQVKESGLPADKLFAAGNKLIGLQFVRPVEASGARGGLQYQADAAQHQRMSKAAGNWLFYALPQSTDPLDQLLTHQKVVFAEATGTKFVAANTFVPEEARSFKELFACIEDDSCGRELAGGYSVEEFLAATQENPMTMYLLVDRGDRIVFAFKAPVG